MDMGHLYDNNFMCIYVHHASPIRSKAHQDEGSKLTGLL